MKRHFSGTAIALAALSILTCTIVDAANVTVVGLFPGKAVVVINGASPRTISVGQKQPEDVTLISASSASAVFDIDGKRHTLDLGEHFAAVGGGSANAVTIAADSTGQFWTIGQINGKTIRLLVDTGATSIALPASVARGMGIDYTKGQRSASSTAGGVVPVYRVALDAVTIGEMTLYRVDATVFESGLDVALLGMSFLNRFEMKRDGAQMTLTKRF
ncbi:MAG: TIGR02281 family clan AA aspartic protease [Usitatibacteraceae bacterium]